MQQITVQSVEELRGKLGQFGSNLLFRGQTSHYGAPGRPSIGTSFDRKGCIPPVMIKWCNYARNILMPSLGAEGDSLEFTHAVLQHYGWRSWFVDCTSDPAVAAWFASHVFKDEPQGGIFEDYEERPVHLKFQFARYEFEEGEANLYLIDRALATEGAGLTDLSAMTIPGSRMRAEAQSAWLIGPMHSRVIPQAAFLAHIRGPRSVFASLARESGLQATSDLFPPPDQDPILRVLLSLPWKVVSWLGAPPSGIPVCQRSLSIPEYHLPRFKIAPPSVAFYQSRSIAPPSSGEGMVVPVPVEVLYGVPSDQVEAKFPKVLRLLEKNGTVVFEADELLRHPHMVDSCIYQKGLVVVRQPDGAIALCELLVEHPGLDLVTSAPARGWFYRASEEGMWIHESHPEQCDCGDASTHSRHLESLKIVEALLPE